MHSLLFAPGLCLLLRFQFAFPLVCSSKCWDDVTACHSNIAGHSSPWNFAPRHVQKVTAQKIRTGMPTICCIEIWKVKLRTERKLHHSNNCVLCIVGRYFLRSQAEKKRSKLDPVKLSSHQQEARHNLRLRMSIRDLRLLYTQAQIGGWSSIH